MGDNNEKGGEIASYIQNQLSQKKPKEEIIETLKGMGWSENDINTSFLQIEQNRKSRRKKIITNITATLLLIVFLAVLLLFAPSSPLKYQKTQKISHGGKTQVTSQNITGIIYDETTGEKRVIPTNIAEKMAQIKAEEEARRASEPMGPSNITLPEEEE